MRASPPVAAPCGRVLVVEDDPDVREALQDALETASIEADAARDGQAALDLLLAGLRPSLVLLDLRMPRMDGEQLYTSMQAHPDLRRIPVVMITSDAHLAPAGVPVLLKPITVSRFLEAVRRHTK